MKERLKVNLEEAVAVVSALIKSGKMVTCYKVSGEYIVRTSAPPKPRPAGAKPVLTGAAKAAHDRKAKG